MDYIFGADIGGTQIKLGAFTKEEGNLVDSWALDTDISDQGSHIIHDIGNSVREYSSAHNATISGIGIGIPGPVDRNGYVPKCVNLNWNGFYAVKELDKELPGIRTAAGNDANVATLGEYMKGAGSAYESAMFITIGTGIGGGVVINGKIIVGAHGIAGEIGHITTDRGTVEHCNCGNLGCIDHISSASGIVRVMREILADDASESSLRALPSFTAKDVCDVAAAGDALAVKCIDKCMEPLAKGMAFFSHAFDPDVFIIGGGVSKAGDTILNPLRKHYNENLFLISKGADIIQASLGNDAGMIGAAMQVM